MTQNFNIPGSLYVLKAPNTLELQDHMPLQLSLPYHNHLEFTQMKKGKWPLSNSKRVENAGLWQRTYPNKLQHATFGWFCNPHKSEHGTGERVSGNSSDY